MDIENAKTELAILIFQCARYERNSTDWREALDKFVSDIQAHEREACAKICDNAILPRTFGKQSRHGKRPNAKLTGAAQRNAKTER